MPAKAPVSGYAPRHGDDYVFRRRRTHAQIEAMTGLILQAVGYPSKRHRDFICALQSVNSGEEARVPFTPYRRAHLTLADLMQISGTTEARRKAVYRETVVLREFQRRAGLLLFHVTPGCEDEATSYIDYLTPAADAAMQRALASALWKTDKAAAKREAVEWAVSQLPRIEPEGDDEQEPETLPLSDYQAAQERRIRSTIERAADEIEKRGGNDYEWLRRLSKELLRIAESRRKTAPARHDYASLSYVESLEMDAERSAAQVSGNKTTWDSSAPSASQHRALQLAPAPETIEEEGVRTVLYLPPRENLLDFDDLAGEPTDETARQPTPLEAALAYARRGWPVFPLHNPDPQRGCSCVEGKNCRSAGKHPRTRKGLKDATTNEAQLRSWWQHWPEANVGLAMGKKSGLVAVDIDPRNGGSESITRLVERYGELPETLEAATGGGGNHVFFSHPGVAFKNSSSALGEGLDVKTDGGYVVAAPSRHASGGCYRWLTTAEPARMPAWLLELLTTSKETTRAHARAASNGNGHGHNGHGHKPASPSGPSIVEGARNETLFRIACAQRGAGAASAEIEAELLELNLRRCQPPLDESEVRSIAASAARYAPGRKSDAHG